MSTKTTFKRVALVAVAALGFGVLTSVAPASAAGSTPTAITVGTIPTAQVGVTSSVPVTVAFPAASASDTFTVNVRVTSAPAGSVYRSLNAATTDPTVQNDVLAEATGLAVGVAATGNTVLGKLTVTQSTSTGIIQNSSGNFDKMTVGALFTAGPAASAAGSASFVINVMPDVAGTYTVLVSTRCGQVAAVATPACVGASTTALVDSSAYTAGDANVTYTFTTGAAASSVVLAAVTPAAAEDGTGRIFKATIKDAAGVVAQLGVNETIALTSNSTTTNFEGIKASDASTLNASATTISLTNANFVNGVAYFRVTNSAAETAILTATGTGLLSSAVTGTITTKTVTAVAVAGVAIANPTGATRPGSGHVGTAAVVAAGTDTASLTATSHSYEVTATTAAGADVIAAINVTDTNGKITGIVGGTYSYALTLAGSGATGTAAEQLVATGTVAITATLSTSGNKFTAAVASSTPATQIVVTSAPSAAIAPTVSPTVTVRGSVGGSVVYVATVTDQFGAKLANQAITVTTTGRNAATAVSTALATDALGTATYTATDSGTAATVATTDTITFTGAGTAPTRSLIWSAAAVSTVTLVTGTEDDTANAVTYRDIRASGVAGAAAGAATITATVKDVNGSILVGVPVVFTTASTGAAVLSTSVTLYTGALGTAAASVYGWTAGTKTFTATAGGIAASGTVNYRQGGATGTDNATEVRTIAATASGNAITVIAKDRFGNVVSGVPLYATRTGNGLFGGGSNTNGQTTDVNGSAEFIFNAGSADSVVTITAGSTTSAVVAYGQTSSAAGALCLGADCVSAAFTAATVGTAITAETGVGASLSPAGVGVVTVSVAATVADTTAADNAQAATDAAAEATDAANAATDAANAAAEAADAATAAAQDAADAVAALSAQVASLISGLKSQLTALTNLVIKIQKKVKA
jgi:hypothetical protein